jgi:catalase
MVKAIINITDDTPIVMLTVGQLREILIPKALYDLIEKQQKIEKERIPKRYVHGVSGIKQLFNCSYPTAHKLKETILKPAVKQQGRVIVVDADLAMKLFQEHEQVKSVKDLKVE